MVSRSTSGKSLRDKSFRKSKPSTPVKPVINVVPPDANVDTSRDSGYFNNVPTSSPKKPGSVSEHVPAEVPGQKAPPVAQPLPDEDTEAPALPLGEDNPLPMAAIPIIFKEATLDTPSFRAYCEHMHRQFGEIDDWWTNLISRNNDIDVHLKPLRFAVNDLLGLFMPPFIYNNVVDQTNMSVVFERYAEGVSGHWTAVMFEARKHFAHISSTYRKFQTGALVQYKSSRERWLQHQKIYDQASAEYLGLSKKTDPTAVCEAAQQVYKYRMRYLRQSLLYCKTLMLTQVSINTLITESLARPFKMDVPLLLPPDKRLAIGHDMHRLHSYAASVHDSADAFAEHYEKIRADMLENIEHRAPPRMHTDYQPAPDIWFQNPSGVCKEKISEKYGWLMVKIPTPKGNKATWSRVWAFVKDGRFGWLSVSPSKTFVQESPCVAVPLIRLQQALHEERNFCFRIATPKVTFTVQTSSRTELHKWLCAFQTALDDFIHQDHSMSIIRPIWTTDICSVAAEKIFPQVVHHESQQAELADKISTRVDACIETISENFTFTDTSATLDLERASKLAPELMQTKPMATSRSVEALVASSFYPHLTVPNAVMANYGGSVNWAFYNDDLKPKAPHPKNDPINLGGNVSTYPKQYPPQMRYHDLDMRAYFGMNMRNEIDEDLVVLVSRARIRLDVKVYSSCIIYLTGRDLYAVSYGAGIGGFLKLALEDLLSVTCDPGIDQDVVKLTYRVGNVYQDMDLRFFIDSGLLFQRRLQFLFDNCKSKIPHKLGAIIESLGKIGREHYNDTHNTIKHERAQYMQNVDTVVKRGLQPIEAKDDSEAPDVYKLHRKESVNQIEHHTEHMTLQAEALFHITPRQLFYILFGDKSDVCGEVISNPDDRKWYYNDNNIEREFGIDLTTLLWFGSIAGSYNHTLNIRQTLTRRDENYFYSVSETTERCTIHSASFKLNTKYIIALTKKGTKLLIYTSIDWLHQSSVAQSVLDMIVEEMCSRRPVHFLESVRKNVRELPRKPNDPHSYDVSAYGRVRIAGVKDDTIVKTRVGSHASVATPILYQLMLKLLTIRFARSVVTFLKASFDWIVNVSSANSWILLIASCSLVANFYLAGTTGANAWREYWQVRNTGKFSAALEMFPQQCILKRSMGSDDVERLLRGDLSEISDSSNSCWKSFKHIALSDPNVQSVDRFGVQAMDSFTHEQINDILEKRLNIAMRRNELLLQFQRLDREELELIDLEWRRWLLHEVRYCAEARQLMALSNQTKLEVALIEYCGPCLEAAKHLL